MRPNKKLKKAETEDFIIIGIIFLLLLLIFMHFYSVFNKKITGSTPKDICKSSVAIHASKHFGDLYVNSPLDCPTQYVTIKEKDKEKVMHELAMSMYNCWDMFGEGRLNLFEQKEGEKVNYCAVCHHIVFSEKMQIPAAEFIDYMQSHNPPGSELTFQEYLTGFSSKNKAAIDYDSNFVDTDNAKSERDLSKYAIDTSIPYATMFTYNKEGYWHKLTTALIGAGIGAGASIVTVIGIVLAPVSFGTSLVLSAVAVGAAGTMVVSGAVIGYSVGSSTATDWESNIHLMPYELSQLKELGCDYLPIAQEKVKNNEK